MKNYPPEFKADAVALYRSRPGATIEGVAAGLGINSQTLRNWIRLDNERRGVAVGGPDPTSSAGVADSVEAENAQLRRRVRELEEERDILRKAARYFAGETRW